jgi:hypothetical protein
VVVAVVASVMRWWGREVLWRRAVVMMVVFGCIIHPWIVVRFGRVVIVVAGSVMVRRVRGEGRRRVRVVVVWWRRKEWWRRRAMVVMRRGRREEWRCRRSVRGVPWPPILVVVVTGPAKRKTHLAHLVIRKLANSGSLLVSKLTCTAMLSQQLSSL